MRFGIFKFFITFLLSTILKISYKDKLYAKYFMYWYRIYNFGEYFSFFYNFKVYFVQTYLCKFIFIFFGLPNFRLHVGLSLFSII